MGNSASGIDPEITLLGSRIWNIHVKDRLLNGSTIELGREMNFEKVFLIYLELIINFILQTARAKIIIT